MKVCKFWAPSFAPLLLFYFYSIGASNSAECIEPNLDSLTSENLYSLTYDNIHKLAVYSQAQQLLRPQKSLHTRTTKSLNGVYDFCLDPQDRGFSEAWFSNNLKSKCNKTDLFRMPVPASMNDVASDKRTRDYIGWFWYQTVINLPTADDLGSHQRFLQFDNINYIALVWVQQLDQCEDDCEVRLVGHHVGGFLPFSANISNFQQSQIRLTVAVSNQLTEDTIPSGRLEDLSKVVGRQYYKFIPDFDFFHFSGIMGDVTLIQLPSIHIYSVDQIQMKDLNFIWLKVCLNDFSQDLEVLIQVSASEEKELFSGVMKVIRRCQRFKIKVSPKWPEFTLATGNINHLAPVILARLSLRKVLVNELSKQSLMDVYEQRLVYRKSVNFNVNTGLMVNGTRSQLQGFGMHQEQLFSGRSMSQAAILKDVYLLKQLGANLIRTSHYPYSSDYLDACDEHGILVIVECAAVGLNSFSELKLALHKQLLRETIQLHHHHPSVIAWSVANEPSSQLPTSSPYFSSLLSYARKELAHFTLDSGRPLTAAIAQQASEDLLGKNLDMIMVNIYFGWYEYTAVKEAVNSSVSNSLMSWSIKHPGIPLLISEFGAGSLQGYHSCYGSIFSEEYQRDLLLEHERVFDEIFSTNRSINFLGSMLWNFADFSVHDSLLRPGGNRKGVFARDRSPKLAMESLRAHYLSRLYQ